LLGQPLGNSLKARVDMNMNVYQIRVRQMYSKLILFKNL
jgi:hypothetical protein